jgi:hypothetical protein
MQLTMLIGQFKLRSRVAYLYLVICEACGRKAQNNCEQGGSRDG